PSSTSIGTSGWTGAGGTRTRTDRDLPGFCRAGEPDLIRRGVAGPCRPDLGLREPGPAPRDGREVVVIDLVAAGPDGDELAVVLGPQRRADRAVEDCGAGPGEPLRARVLVPGGHGGPPVGISPFRVYPRRAPVSAFAVEPAEGGGRCPPQEDS